MIINKFLITRILICVIISLTTANNEEIKTNDKCKHFITAGNGSFILPSEEKCDAFVYRFECLKDSSIISITTSLDDSNNNPTYDSGNSKWIEVTFEEFTDVNIDVKPSITVKRWIIKPQKNLSNHNEYYFSRTFVLVTSISVHGNWSDNNLTFYYKEIAFNDYVTRSSAEAGEITPWVSEKGRKYRPNCVSVFQITKSRDMNASSIHLVLNKLDIDEGIGEYLLIGAGSNPFEGPPPLFISSSQHNKEFKINDENAYIVFVATSTRTQYEGFNITWRYNGTKISVKEDIISKHEDVHESMPICIYNTSAALAEFDRPKPFFEFREKLALIGSEYAKNNSKHFKINSTQVHIFRVSGVIPKDAQNEDLKEGALYVMVKIQGSKEGTAAFKWNQLEDILNYYSNFYSEETRGFKINRCPDQSQKTMWTNVGLYAIVPVVCCLFLLIWTWKYNPLSNLFTKNLKKMSIQASPIEESDYIFDSNACTIPKVYVTDDQDRRRSVEESSCEEQDSDLEIFNKKEFKKSFKRHTNIKESRSTRSSTRSSKKPEINMAFEDDAGYSDKLQNTPKTRNTAKEDVHETLNSQESLLYDSEKETKL